MNAATRLRDFSLSRARLSRQRVDEALQEMARILSTPTGWATLLRRTLFIGLLAVALVLFERLAVPIALGAFAYILAIRRLERSESASRAAARPTSVRASAAREAGGGRDESGSLAEVIPLNNAFAPAWQDVDDFLQATLDVIKTRFEFQSANIFLRGENKGVLVQRAFVSRTPSIARLATIRVGVGLVGWVAQHKRPLVVGNLHHEGRSMGYYRAAGEQVGSFAAAPILARGEVVGVIALDHAKPDAFPEGTDEALVAVAGLLARVLGAEETMDRARHDRDRIRESWRLLRAAYDATDLDSAAESTLKELVTLADFHALAIYLLDENGTPSRRASIGFHGIWGNEIKEPLMNRAVTQAVQQASPFRLEGPALAAQYRATRIAPSRPGGLKTAVSDAVSGVTNVVSSAVSKVAGEPPVVVPELLLALPILHRGQALGVLVVEVAAARTLDERIEGILADVAADLGSALVRVYNAALAQGAAKSEGELVRFSNDLLPAESTEEVWDRIFSLLLKRTPATAAIAWRRGEGEYTIEAVAGCTPTDAVCPLDEGLLGWTALAGRPVMSRRGDRRRAPVEEGESFLAFPVGPGRTPRTIVVLISNAKQAFGAECMEIVSGVAATAYPVLVALDRLEEARRELDTDVLTGACNERGFRRRLGVMAINGTLSVVVLAIENHEALLAEYGRKEVGVLLRRIANVLETAVGADGAVARIDGGRFAAAIRGDAEPVRHSLEELLQNSSLMTLYETPVRGSVATASLDEGLGWEELLEAAESRLSRRAFAAAAAEDPSHAADESEVSATEAAG